MEVRVGLIAIIAAIIIILRGWGVTFSRRRGISLVGGMRAYIITSKSTKKTSTALVFAPLCSGKRCWQQTYYLKTIIREQHQANVYLSMFRVQN